MTVNTAMPFALTLGGVTFILAVIWGSPLMEVMRRLRLGKQIRIEGPQSHMSKMGTPAMGGILIIGWTVIVTLIVNMVQVLETADVAASLIVPLYVVVAYAIWVVWMIIKECANGRV